MESKKCGGCCPECGAKDDSITWGVIYLVDNQIFRPATCMLCNCIFKEWYTYDETEYEQDN